MRILAKVCGFIGVTGLSEIPLLQDKPNAYLAVVISITGHVVIKMIDRHFEARRNNKKQTP